MSDPSVPTPDQVEAIWGRERSLRAQLCVSVDESYARALTLARRWFEDGFDFLGGAFDQAAAERVFDLVAPVLPPGRPNMWAVHPPNVLSSRDPLEAP
jgi:hypothetical protein